jgi:two-component system NarL family sensor kinase
MSSIDLPRVRAQHHTRSLRIAAVLRVGVVAIMVGAMLVGTERSYWPQQTVLLGLYGLAAAATLVLAFTPRGASVIGLRQRLVFAILDVAVLFGFQLLSTGGYVPLLVMALVPLIVVPQVSWRRACAVLTVSVAAFVYAVLEDDVIPVSLGWRDTVFLFVIYAFLCGTGVVVAYVEERHVDEIAALSASREELLGQVMTAAELERRRISEAIHDGPLQDVLVARQEIGELAGSMPAADLDRAVRCLRDASQQLRDATFELHPAVLEQVGLGAAVEQLATFTAHRARIAIDTHIDYPVRNALDAIVFGVVRELLSNVVRHSRADHASVTLVTAGPVCRLDVADNGIGVTTAAATHRLAQGHIGLASHRARVEAAGGTFTITDAAVGTHVRVEVPLRDQR